MLARGRVVTSAFFFHNRFISSYKEKILSSKLRRVDLHLHRISPFPIKGRNSTTVNSFLDKLRTIWQYTYGTKDGKIYEKIIEDAPKIINLLGEKGEVVKEDSLFKLLTTFGYNKHENLLPVLAKHIKIFDKRDEMNWTCLHWAIISKNIPLIQTIIESGVNINELSEGSLTPYELALWSLDHTILESCKISYDDINNLSIDFFQQTLGKLNDHNDYLRNKDGILGSKGFLFYRYMEKSALDLEELSQESSIERELIYLYTFNNLSNFQLYTKTGFAVINKDINSISELIKRGWSYDLEMFWGRKLLNKYPINSPNFNNVEGTRYAISSLERSNDNKDFLIKLRDLVANTNQKTFLEDINLRLNYWDKQPTHEWYY